VTRGTVYIEAFNAKQLKTDQYRFSVTYRSLEVGKDRAKRPLRRPARSHFNAWRGAHGADFVVDDWASSH
jgi:hypothetical protein